MAREEVERSEEVFEAVVNRAGARAVRVGPDREPEVPGADVYQPDDVSEPRPDDG